MLKAPTVFVSSPSESVGSTTMARRVSASVSMGRFPVTNFRNMLRTLAGNRLPKIPLRRHQWVELNVRLAVLERSYPMELGEGDFRILEALQTEGRLSNQELAERAGMSTSPCWRRVRRLEEVGVIQGYQAQIDRAAVGLGVLAFIRVKINAHSQKEA